MSESKSPQDLSINQLQRESEFHDDWASSVLIDEIEMKKAFEGVTAPENRFILSMMGDLTNKRVLDIGCGLGESSVYFALKGAQVTALDLSPKMISLTNRLAEKFNVKLNGIASSIEDFDCAQEAFDFIYLGNIIHHVNDRESLYAKLKNLLKDDGTLFSWDPLAYNPIINVYRMLAMKVRTIDEKPLKIHDISQLKKHFTVVKHREFWLLTLIIMLKYYFIDRVSPNEERYWKKILTEPDEKLGWFKFLQKLDAFLLRVPGINWLAWNTVIWARKTT